MAFVGRVVSAATTAHFQAADPIAGRDGSSATAGRIETQVQGEVITAHGPWFDPDFGTT